MATTPSTKTTAAKRSARLPSARPPSARRRPRPRARPTATPGRRSEHTPERPARYAGATHQVQVGAVLTAREEVVEFASDLVGRVQEAERSAAPPQTRARRWVQNRTRVEREYASAA